jgi:hypothetical protein
MDILMSLLESLIEAFGCCSNDIMPKLETSGQQHLHVLDTGLPGNQYQNKICS